MKVSIKNLHITFKGQPESEPKAAPTEFYSPLERELRTELEATNKERDHLRQALLQAHKDRFADKLKPDDAGNIIADRLGVEIEKLYSTVRETQRERDDMTKSRDRLVTAHKACVEELALIVEWTKGYDDGKWPDHNAKGLNHTSKEVLHMLRDFQADIESRPLPGSAPTGWRTNDSAASLDGTHAAIPYSDVPPFDSADPVGVGQPAPETPTTQPAAPESAMPVPATAPQMPTTKVCPGFNCSNYLGMYQTFCDDCQIEHRERLAEMENEEREPQNVTADADQYEPTLSCKERPPCKAEGCDEPSRPHLNSSYCFNHRKPTDR